MSTAILTSKGKLTLPKPVHEALSLAAGDRVEFIALGGGRFELTAVTRDVTELRGMLGPVNAVVSIEDMDEAIAKTVCNSISSQDLKHVN